MYSKKIQSAVCSLHGLHFVLTGETVVEVKTVECSKIDSAVPGIVRLSEANNSIGCTRILPR